jgi:hypothetical protein
MKTTTIIGLLLCVLVSIATAQIECSITIKNLDTEGKLIYTLFWVDHPWQDEFPFPYNFAGGELEADTEITLESTRLAGEYIITWQPADNSEEKHIMEFTIRPYDYRCIVVISSQDGEMVMTLQVT